MKRRSFLQSLLALPVVAKLVPSRAVAASPPLPVPAPASTLAMSADDSMSRGTFVYWGEGGGLVPATDTSRKILGVTARPLKKGEAVLYDPTGNTRDIITHGVISVRAKA